MKRSLSSCLLALAFLTTAPTQAFVFFTDPLNFGSESDNSGAIFIELDAERIFVRVQISGVESDPDVVGRSIELEIGGETYTGGLTGGQVLSYTECSSVAHSTGRSLQIGDGLYADANLPEGHTPGDCGIQFEDTSFYWVLDSSPEVEAAAKDELFYSVRKHLSSGAGGTQSSSLDSIVIDASIIVDAIPEPSSSLLMIAGLGLLSARRKR